MERIKLLLHTSFYDQLVGILPVLSRTIDVPVQRLRPTVDAGSCEILNSNPDADAVGPKARCLPSYIIIGAQKSGTDELSVYLNRNTLFNRRMDGGVEVHFFDCVGRGQGNLDQDKDSFRLSCARLRTSLMGSTNPTSTKGSEQAFTWKEVSKLTPFADELYTHYIKLGQMTARQFTREHRTLVFEKSPSYLDLADVRDVARILPRGKFVFLSRDPVPRLVSAYFQYCEAYDMERASQNCTMQEFEEFTRALVMGKLDITTMDGSLPRRLAFYRGALYGMYNRYLTKWLKYFWVDNKLEEKQFLMVDSSHFKQHPKAVLYAVESFVGLRGQRHFDYSPRMSNGKYIYGESSKALHPTHQSKTLSLEIEQLLREYYRPSVDAFRELLLQERGPIVFGLMYDTFPTSLTSPGNPQIFNSSSRFSLPDWLR
ncbi:hypothetical protein BASA81_006382 [Batrachochytrium salamandrivorans]|nr:hypothetical protein BASA81_006382 [Batrachochytrium salamandrivorans]